MENFKPMSRRAAVKSSVFGLLTVSIPRIAYAKTVVELPAGSRLQHAMVSSYPSIDDKIVAEIVGASHFNLDRVKELVEPRPELARAAWDWAFGDWETAIGAASHVGRRDIVGYLLQKGARPDIFTFATLGAHDAVKAMITAKPGIQSIAGPHGISLLQHVQNGLRSEGLTSLEKKTAQKLIAYLEKLGGANLQQENMDMANEEKEKYLGDYKYGDGEGDGFSVRLNMRKLLSLGKIGNFGGALYKQGTHTFAYNGTPSVTIKFASEADRIVSLTVQEPSLTLTAIKI